MTKLLVPLLACLTLASLAAAAGSEVSLKRLDGSAVQGRLSGLSAASIELATPAGPQSVALAEVLSLDFGRPPLGKPSVWVELADGSRLSAMAYVSSQGTAQIKLASGKPVELPSRAIRSLRFYQQSPELAGQWREIASSQATGDVLVIRKVSTRLVEQGDEEPRSVTEYALDQVEGAILEITPDAVRFELDGEKINVRREKLEGVIFYQRGRQPLPAPRCRLLDTAASSWLLADFSLNDNRLSAQTLGGHPVEFALNEIAKLDFSVGNVAYLSDLEADTTGDLGVSLQPANMTQKFSRIFALRAGPPLGADSFRIGGERYDNGLSLHSPLKLNYRIPEGFRKFHAVAGIDDSMLAPGRFSLTILADGKQLVRHEFSDEQRKPLALALNIAQARRLTIILEAGDGQDIGDQLNLCEARFTK